MDRLYERDAEIAALDRAVSALGRGRGSAVLVEARAGRGKSTLVQYAVDTSRAIGARVLVARARHLESAAPFEVLRRLLGPAVEESGGPENLTGAARFAAPLFVPGAQLTQGVDYGSQWLVARLAEDGPLVLAVDDAHWADAASLRVLLEVQAEISVQPVLLLLASRPVENPDAQRRLATMAAQPDCVLLTPARLSREGVHAVVVDTLGDPVHEVFVDDCLQASGGNAFYLHELLRPYRADFRPDQQTFVKDGTMSLRRTMSWRLSELGTAAAELAQTAAVLGDGCSLRVAGELAGLDESAAVAEAARLEAASVFAHGDPVDFVHPLIRAAVEKTLTQVGVGELHGRAARLLWSRGAPSSEVVPHLVASPGSGDAQVEAFLTEHGRSALESGSVAVAARLLRRALDEQPPPERRNAVLVRLAQAEHALRDHDAAREHLGEALESADRAVAMAAAAQLFDVLFAANQFVELGRLGERVVAMRPYGDSRVEVQLRAELLAIVFMAVDPRLQSLPAELSDVDASSLPEERDIDRYLLVTAAVYERTMQRGTTERLVANLKRAVAGIPSDADALSDWDVRVALTAATFLADEELEATEAILDRVAPAAARFAGVMPDLQAELDHRRIVYQAARGDFEDALAALDLAEEMTARHRLIGFEGHHRFARGVIALERGDYAQAGELLSERIGEDLVYPALGALLSGSPERAIAMLETLDLSSEPDAPARPIEVELQPHLVASHAFVAAGDRVTAEREAEREVAVRRRYGSSSRLALALRRRSSFLPAREAAAMLEEAVSLAEDSLRRPLQARILASYGVALRRSDKHREAREALYRAAELAAEMGMERVRARAQRELVLAGGRPRRTRQRGPASLTDSQRQVASMAAEGLTNREIAEQLFVTIKTVETHLMAAYRKLGIATRDELTAALESSPVPSPRLDGPRRSGRL